MPRSKKQNIINQTNLQSPKEFLRFATPEQIANYRAERLKCNIIVELGAGIGGQTLAFSRKCKKVIAVEIDKKRVSILLQNLKKLRIKNVEIINGDALNKSVVQKISKESPDIIFFDTERPEQAERTLDKISPPIEKILETYSEISSKIAIEIPPFTKDIEQLKKNYNFEEEFISLDNQLNRLTLYFNELKSSEKSAVALPSKEKIYPDKNSKPQEIFSAKNFRYLYVIDPTIILADLEDEIAEKFNLKILNLDKPIFLSNEIAKSGFLIHYKILELSENKSDKIKKSLKKISAGKVVLRYKLNPEDYWKTRNSYEKGLKGRREIHLFINEKNNEAILCEKV